MKGTIGRDGLCIIGGKEKCRCHPGRANSQGCACAIVIFTINHGFRVGIKMGAGYSDDTICN